MTPETSQQQPSINPDLISPRVMMGLIGLLGFLLPIILFFSSIIIDDCREVQTSISAYYHTGSGDALVGMICALSFALFAYKGYNDDAVINDSLVGTFASVFALGVAFFPTSIDVRESSECVKIFDNHIYGVVHYISAILLFFTLAYFSIVQFTKTKGKYCFSKTVWKNLSARKKQVNKFYIICGCVILICILLAGIYFLISDENTFKKWMSTYKPVFILETIMLWSFSIAWLRKSKLFGKFTKEEMV